METQWWALRLHRLGCAFRRALVGCLFRVFRRVVLFRVGESETHDPSAAVVVGS